MNAGDIERAGLREGQMVSLVSDAGDGIHREVGPLKVTPFKLPDGCVGSYYPEMNPLMALSHHDKQSKTPAAKSVPVKIRAVFDHALCKVVIFRDGCMQIFRPGANTIATLLLASLGVMPVLAVGLAYQIVQSPYVTGQNVTRDQPVPFSHEHHVGGLGLDCRYCHTSVEKARFAGLPPTETCMTCHSQLWTNADMLAPVHASLAENKPIHWQRVNNLPDYVYFDHSIHIAKGVGCTTCHGPIGQMKLTRQAAPLTMNWCIDCHRDPTKALRPREAVFDPDWKPTGDRETSGHRLMAAYHIRTDHLTDCSICHR